MTLPRKIRPFLAHPTKDGEYDGNYHGNIYTYIYIYICVYIYIYMDYDGNIMESTWWLVR